MTVPESITTKLERAWEHLDGLKNEVADRIADFQRDGVIRNRDADTGDHIWQVVIGADETKRVSVLAGDFIHNLRSTLDHLIYSLAASDQRPLPEFPIYQNPNPAPDGFHGAGIAKIWTLPPEAKIVVEGMQPYHGGNEPLLLIHRLDAVDKHRRLLAVPYVIHRIGLGMSATGIIRNLQISTGRFKSGDVIARMSANNPPEEVEKVKLNCTFQIAVEEEGVSGEIVAKLSPLYDFVEKVVLPKFEPLF